MSKDEDIPSKEELVTAIRDLLQNGEFKSMVTNDSIRLRTSLCRLVEYYGDEPSVVRMASQAIDEVVEKSPYIAMKTAFAIWAFSCETRKDVEAKFFKKWESLIEKSAAKNLEQTYEHVEFASRLSSISNSQKSSMAVILNRLGKTKPASSSPRKPRPL